MTKQLLVLAVVAISLASVGQAAEQRTADAPPVAEPGHSAFSVHKIAPGEYDILGPADAFPCRLRPAGNPDVVQLGIGPVESLRCNALYSPSRDEAISFEQACVALTRRGGAFHLTAQGQLAVRTERDFMKTKGGIPFFRPLKKSAFARAPGGWCSWYVFWQGIREEQVTQNTDWLAKNLKQFGCEYVQIDDGWQGVGQGDGINRNWYVTEKNKFPHGMKWLADYIRAKGLRPGIWLIPFATSDEKTFRERPELFVRRPDGGSVYETPNAATGKLEVDWTGRYVVDPTSPSARKWFEDLFRMICDDWGYDYVKIDGQGGSIGACCRPNRALISLDLPAFTCPTTNGAYHGRLPLPLFLHGRQGRRLSGAEGKRENRPVGARRKGRQPGPVGLLVSGLLPALVSSAQRRPRQVPGSDQLRHGTPWPAR
jgi:hypothetical protein